MYAQIPTSAVGVSNMSRETFHTILIKSLKPRPEFAGFVQSYHTLHITDFLGLSAALMQGAYKPKGSSENDDPASTSATNGSKSPRRRSVSRSPPKERYGKKTGNDRRRYKGKPRSGSRSCHANVADGDESGSDYSDCEDDNEEHNFMALTLAPETDTCSARFADDNKRGKFVYNDVSNGPVSYAFFAQMSDHDAFTLEEDDMPPLVLTEDSDDDEEQRVLPSPTDPLNFSDILTQHWVVDSDAPPITCHKKGKAYLKGLDGSLIILNDVLLAPPKSTCNILSVPAALRRTPNLARGFTSQAATFTSNITSNSKDILSCPKQHGDPLSPLLFGAHGIPKSNPPVDQAEGRREMDALRFSGSLERLNLYPTVPLINYALRERLDWIIADLQTKSPTLLQDELLQHPGRDMHSGPSTVCAPLIKHTRKLQELVIALPGVSRANRVPLQWAICLQAAMVHAHYIVLDLYPAMLMHPQSCAHPGGQVICINNLSMNWKPMDYILIQLFPPVLPSRARSFVNLMDRVTKQLTQDGYPCHDPLLPRFPALLNN
eukprot:gene4327-biopygen22052